MSNDNPRRRRVIDPRDAAVGIVALAVFVGCVAVVIVNQQTVGWTNLVAMLAGLAGLIVLLALYNRTYR